MSEIHDPSGESKSTSSTDFKTLYEEAHPDAVKDPAEAEAMAYAGDEFETYLARSQREAIEHIQRIGQDDGIDHAAEARQLIDMMVNERGIADWDEAEASDQHRGEDA